MALPFSLKLLWTFRKLFRILVLYGIFAIIIIWYNLPAAFTAVLEGEQAVWTLIPFLAAEWELLVLLAITFPIFAFLIIVPHKRVDRRGRRIL